MTPPVRTVSAEIRETVERNSNRLTAIETELAHSAKDRESCVTSHGKAEETCRGERREAEKELANRMTTIEKAVGEQAVASTTLAGTVTRYMEAQAQEKAAGTADKDREVKVVDSKRGHLTAITCALISVVGALLVGYMSWAAKAASADLPAVVSAAVAEGVKQALAAR